MKVKNDHRSKFSNLSNWKEEAWKNQSFNGIRTRDLRVAGALLYQLSYNNKWILEHAKIANPDEKFVIPKRDIFKKLCEAHSAIAHRGRDKTKRYMYMSHMRKFHKK